MTMILYEELTDVTKMLRWEHILQETPMQSWVCVSNVPPLLTSLFYVMLSDTTDMNCFVAFDLIKVVHPKAVNLIKST